MQLTSAMFQQEGRIPAPFTCDGQNVSPELSWRDAPAETKFFALILHDPDAPKDDGFTHWVLYNIPSDVAALEVNVPHNGLLQGVGVQGMNDSGKIGYTGPCPPSGTHRYFFRLYALDAELKLQPGASRDEVEAAMSGHILDQAELMGTYSKSSQKAA
ncbi:MAG TPA: YbhB/YbcL family Raf kinase inhibitor-like protein [Terriglobales bacterium]|nr:YbhB/YbcL family Raf kinase inhibitor-like protein [Terriglobales bacterium]